MRFTLLFLVLLLLSGQASGWGEMGHRLVGEMAERQLSPNTLAEVQALLADEAEPSLAGVASWADMVRDQPAYRWTTPLHYVNIRDASCRYAPKRDCRKGECVVAAIERYARALGDRSLRREERTEALKFLVHFVGDVHQPLHSGHRPDKGGNEFQISLRWRSADPEATNLHSVWDYFLLRSAGRNEADYAQHLMSELPTALDPIPASAWAEASCKLTDSDGFYPRRPGKLPADYFDRMRPLAERRVREASVRLAGLIESALAERR